MNVHIECIKNSRSGSLGAWDVFKLVCSRFFKIPLDFLNFDWILWQTHQLCWCYTVNTSAMLRLHGKQVSYGRVTRRDSQLCLIYTGEKLATLGLRGRHVCYSKVTRQKLPILRVTLQTAQVFEVERQSLLVFYSYTARTVRYTRVTRQKTSPMLGLGCKHVIYVGATPQQR